MHDMIFIRSLILLLGTSAAVSHVAVAAITATEPPLKNSFGAQFIQSFEFIDFPDLLVAIVAKNNVPWLRYEKGELYAGRKSTLQSRWQKALALPVQSSLAISDQLRKIHDVLTDDLPSDFRGTPIDDAGGDVDGFDRVTLEEFRALAGNPLLVLESKPDGTNLNSKLIRYKYPSASTYEKFSHLLSPALVQKIKTAKQNFPSEWVYVKSDYKVPQGGANPTFCPNHPHFCELTREILTELLNRYAFKRGDPATVNYQRMIATHPFDDYNGRTMRVWYRVAAERPLFLLAFYCDLYCSPQKFSQTVQEANRQFDLITAGLVAEEKRVPSSPDFYSIPEFWMVAAGKVTRPSNPALFTSESQRYFDQVAVKQAIDHKFFAQVLSEYRAFVVKNRF